MNDVVRALRSARAEGQSAIEVALLSREKLGTGFGVISFVASFRLAFAVPLPVLQRAQAWDGFGWGGVPVSDEEFTSLLAPWFAGR